METLSAKDKILHAAHDLFYENGIRATGIDKIIKESGVAKLTFYRHFPSKNDLILAFLEYRHRRWINWFAEALARHGASSGGGLKPLVPALTEWFESPSFRGCAFINSVAELGESKDVVKISRSHKQDMTDIVEGLLPKNKKSKDKANAVALAIDGAIFSAQLKSKQKKQEVIKSLSLLINCIS